MHIPPDTLLKSTTVTVEETKRRIDAYLRTVFDERIQQAAQVSPDYAQLWKTMAALSAAGGKRLRPYVTLLSYSVHSTADTIDDIIPAAAAQELLHLAMLIHDDIIDRDERRYGIKNVTGQYDDLYAPLIADPIERRHFSNSAAIMAGDLLISEAYRLIHRCGVDSVHIAKAHEVLSEAIFHVSGGELLDTESAFRPFEQINALTIAEQKTASYSFVSPLLMGAHLANAPAGHIATLTQFGTTLGIAYQLQDDILGVFGNEMLTGKSTSGDIIEGKHTHLVEQFYQRAANEQKQEFSTIFKNEQATDEQLDRVRQLLIQSGAKEAVERVISELALEAHAHLRQLGLTESNHRAFTALIERSIHRDK